MTIALRHDRRALVGLDVRRVEEHVREGGVVEAALAEGGDDRVELAADAAHLALADPGVDAQGPHEVVDLAGARRRGRTPPSRPPRGPGRSAGAARAGRAGSCPRGTWGCAARRRRPWCESRRVRLPLRWVVRSSVRSYRPAPIAAVASSSMSSWSTSVIASRMTSIEPSRRGWRRAARTGQTVRGPSVDLLVVILGRNTLRITPVAPSARSGGVRGLAQIPPLGGTLLEPVVIIDLRPRRRNSTFVPGGDDPKARVGRDNVARRALPVEADREDPLR